MAQAAGQKNPRKLTIMASVGISEAARLAGVSRQHLYKMVQAGQISVNKELLPGKEGSSPKDYRQFIDVSELQRVFGQLFTGPEIVTSAQSEFASSENELNAIRCLLKDKEAQLQEAKEREIWLKNKVDEMAATVKLISLSTPGHSNSPNFVSSKKYEATVKTANTVIKDLRQQLRQERERSQGFWAWFFGR